MRLEFTRRSLLGVLGLGAASGLAAQQKKSSASTRILVVCTGNSARSQMAEGFLKSFDPALEVYSAGTKPAARVNPYAVRVMHELGFDISRATTKGVSQFLDQQFDYVVTVCDDADKSCPNFRGKVGKRSISVP